MRRFLAAIWRRGLRWKVNFYTFLSSSFFFASSLNWTQFIPPTSPEIFMRLLLGHRRLLNGSPLWTAASIHSETMLSLRPLDPPSYWSACARLPGVAHLLFSAWFIFCGGVEIGALIGLFTHGLAIKKLLVTLQLSAQCNRCTSDKVIITVCAERLNPTPSPPPTHELCLV